MTVRVRPGAPIIEAEYGRGLSVRSHKPGIAGSNPASATKFTLTCDRVIGNSERPTKAVGH